MPKIFAYDATPIRLTDTTYTKQKKKSQIKRLNFSVRNRYRFDSLSLFDPLNV